MSNAIVFAKNARKPFKGLSLSGVITAVLPEALFPENQTVKPSDFKMNNAVAGRLAGDALTPIAFASLAGYVLARVAQGQHVDSILTNPSAARAALVQAASAQAERHGGITAGALRVGIANAFKALLALPERKEKPAVEAPAVEAPAVEAPAVEAPSVEPINASCGNLDNPVVDAWFEASIDHDARMAAQQAEQAKKLDLERAEQARVDSGFLALNAEIRALSSLVLEMAQAPNIKAVRALARQSGFKVAA